jgi:hypothetical protein
MPYQSDSSLFGDRSRRARAYARALRWALADLGRRLGDLLPRRFVARDVAICTIHGSSSYSAEAFQRYPWPRLQLDQLRAFTPPGYTVYAYSNGLLPQHDAIFDDYREVRLFSVARNPHYHSVSEIWAIRNWLAKQAARQHRYIIHLDSDAFPVRQGWLAHYVGLLRWHRPVVAVKRVENGDQHSDRCFLMYRRGDLHRHLFDMTMLGQVDAGGGVSAQLEQQGLGWTALLRSNRHDYHPLIAGIYDDRIYHHAAGSRTPHFRQNSAIWAEPERMAQEQQLHQHLMERLFADPAALLAELRGERPAFRF